MIAGARIAVVVPAYDEGALIEGTLLSMPDLVDRVIVVDDASSDETADVAESIALTDPRVRVFRHTSNRGVGAAISTGYSIAFAEGADMAVVMAGDGQMHPDDLPALALAIATGGVDYAKGNRFAWPDAARLFPWQRYLGGQVFSVLTRLATGLAVGDSQCGFTALSRRAAARIDLGALWPRYGYPNDMLGLAAGAGLVVRDVPVRPVYAGERSGLSLRHVVTMLPRVLARVALRRIASTIRRAPALSRNHRGAVPQ